MPPMRYFFHVTEFGHAGYQYLPALAFVAEDLVLWSPSGLQLEEAQKENSSAIGPEDLLRLVDERKVRIVGREPWLTERRRREDSPWPLAEWTDGYDSEILRIAEQDRALPEDERRVFFVGRGHGEEWAENELAENTPRVDLVRDLIGGKDALDLDKTHLLPGLVDKLSRAESEHDRLRLTLSDIRNHILAGEEVNADVPVEPAPFKEIVVDLASERERSLPDPGPATRKGWRQLVEVVNELSAPRTPEDVQALLSLGDRRSIQLEIDRLLLSESPRDVLAANLEGAPRLPSLEEELELPPLFNRALDLLSIMLCAIAEPAAGATIPPAMRLGYAASKSAEVIARRPEREEEIVVGNGLILPLVLTYGDATATYERLGELRRIFGQGGEKRLPF